MPPPQGARIRRILLPPLMPPLTRGLSNAQHLTGGEIFSFLSLRHALRRATSLVRGRNNGSSRRQPPTNGRAWKPAPTTGRRVVAPYARITVCLFPPTNPNLSSCAIAKDLTYKRNHICKSFFAERRRMTKTAGFSNLAAFIVCLHTKRKNPDAYASGISGSRYKTNHLPHLLTTSNAVDGERGKSSFVVSIS